MKVGVFLSTNNQWFLLRNSNLEHSHHPELDDPARALGENDIEDSDDWYVPAFFLKFSLYSQHTISLIRIQINILYDANVAPCVISTIMSKMHEDNNGTFLPKTLFNMTDVAPGH
jgi:hypothetical protein